MTGYIQSSIVLLMQVYVPLHFQNVTIIIITFLFPFNPPPPLLP